MFLSVTFAGNGVATVRLVADNEEERAILAFVVCDPEQGVVYRPRYEPGYRPSGVREVVLERHLEPAK